jgi:hypothetical protein
MSGNAKLFLLNDDNSTKDIFKDTPSDLTHLCVAVPKEQALKEYLYWLKTRCANSNDPECLAAYASHSAAVTEAVRQPGTSIVLINMEGI